MSRELTDFQKAVLWAVERGLNRQACLWEIAEVAFPDKWKKESARGALIQHIDRAAMQMSDLVHRLPPKDEHGTATICLKHYKPCPKLTSKSTSKGIEF